MTIEELKDRTRDTESQLGNEIEERDMILLAVHFDNVETLSVQLRLDPSQRKDVKNVAFLDNTQTAVDKALRLCRKANPGAAIEEQTSAELDSEVSSYTSPRIFGKPTILL